MRELDVVGVRVEMPSNAPMVLLREVGGRTLWAGRTSCIAQKAQSQICQPSKFEASLSGETGQDNADEV